jgi:hypothetical protein
MIMHLIEKIDLQPNVLLHNVPTRFKKHPMYPSGPGAFSAARSLTTANISSRENSASR